MARFVLTAQLQLQGPTNVRQIVSDIQRQLSGVDVNVNVRNGPQAQRQVRQIADECNRATGAASNLGRALGISIRRFAGLAIATRAVSLFTNTLGAAVREAIAFERELIKISQVTGKTVSQLKDLTNTITSLATGLGVSSTSLLQTSRILSQAGLSARETEIALKALAKTELAPTFDNIGDTAEGAVAIFNQFRQGAEALEGQLGSLNAVAGKFAVESGDLISVIRRTGGVFKAAGGDLNQLIALFTSVRSTTRESAESIATGLRTILTRIQRPRTIEYLRQYGVELETLEGKFVGPFEAIRRLSEATAGLEQGDLRFIEIAEEIAGFRQIGKVIPLLREFRVSQEALAVAQAGVNSLTDDAAKAQFSLAIRIAKVKEEFLSLVRSITETTSFQVMASVVLTLAESLIRLGEAIKPILPLLSALVAFRSIRGIGGFLSNIPRGFANARGFASGGMVPGTGNRDTVPAMLTPGEFVIKKSSVAKLGANNLAAMNENRYAAGGTVTSGRHAYGPDSLVDELINEPPEKNLIGDSRFSRLTRQQVKFVNSQRALKASKGVAGGTLRDRQRGEEKTQISGAKLFKSFGVSFLEGSAPIQATIKEVLKRSNITGQQKLQAAIQASGKTVKDSAKIVTTGEASTLQPNASKIFDETLISKIPGLFDEVAKRFNVPLAPISATNQQLFSKGALNAIRGNFFEAFLKRVTNNIKKDDIQDKSDPIFDIKSSPAISKLREMFGGKFVLPNELKVTASRENVASAVGKAIAESNPSQLKLFARGGSVGSGTDTVPALLTPGEFVINRSSAKSIGYSNLNRMNQVGKYAAGGIVTHNRHAYGNATAPFIPMVAPGSTPGMGAGPALERVAKSADEASSKFDKSGNSAFILGTSALAVQSGLSALRPDIDENSSAFQKNAAAIIDAGQGLIGIITATGIALQTFGVQLNAANLRGVFDLITSGTGKFVRPLAKIGINLAKTLGGNTKTFAKLAIGAGRLATGLGIATVATSALKGLSDSFFDFDNRLQKAISEGNIEQAGSIARSQQASNAVFGTLSGAASGAAIGALFGPLGIAIGATAGGFYGLISSLDTTAASFAEARAKLAKSDIDLKSSTDAAAESLKNFKRNADEASREELSRNVSKAQSELIKSSKTAGSEIEKLSQEQSGIHVPFSTELGFSDRVDRYSTGINDQKIQQLQEQSAKSLREGIRANQEGVDAIIKDVIQAVGGEAELKDRGVDPEALFKAAGEAFSESTRALKRGDKVAQQAALERAAIFREEGQRQQTAIDNQTKALNDLTNKMKTFSVSLSQAIGAANAANVSLTNLQNSFDPSKSGLQNSISTLEASTTSAARGMDAAQFESALNSASEAMIAYGASSEAVKQFRTNLTGVASAQKELPSIIAQVDDQIKQSGSIDPDAQLRTFTTAIDKQLQQSGVDNSTRKAFVDELGKDLTDEEKKRVRAGGTTRERVFEERLKKLGETINQDAIPAIKAIAENDEKLANILRKRIESENNLIKAQQQAVDIFLEARQLEAGFGGAPVTTVERRQAVAARSNVLGRAAGLSDVSTDVESFRRRREEIRAGFAATQSRRSQILAGGGAASAAEKTALTGQEDRLRQAQQDQVKSLRDLIKIQQDEIKTIQEKQRLEKESLDSLLTGDIDKFFEQQAAQGAIAAAATGNAQVMGAFGADATAAAAKELQRLQAAGVTEIYGQQIGGAGGLAESTALAGFRQRGLNGQAGVRAAQIYAGTTPELEAARATGRGLSAELAAAGDLGAGMAADELSTAGQMLQEAARRITEAIAQERGGRQRGETTGKILAQDKVIKKQEGVVDTKKQELVAVQDAQKKVEEENTKKSEQYGGWVAYATKVQKEGGQLSQEEQEMMSEVIEEKRKLAQESAEAERKVLEAKEAVKNEEDKLLQEQNKKQKMVQSLDAGRQRILPDAIPAPSSASSSTGATPVPSFALSSAGVGGVFDLGRQVAGNIGEAEGKRRGESSFFGFGGLFGGGEIGAARGREAAQAQYDSIFGGLDEQSTETLNNFANSVQSLQGMEVAHKLGDMNINLGGVDFLANMQPEIRNTVIDELQKQLDNYRPSSAGMRQNKGVLPTA